MYLNFHTIMLIISVIAGTNILHLWLEECVQEDGSVIAQGRLSPLR